MIIANAEILEYTGERMVPEHADINTFWEHIYRYRFAANYVHGKRVLDIACGEGYGAAALERAGAVSVIGVDIAAEACKHAKRKYGIDARVGSAENIPLPDMSVDVLVSFETIEHVPNPGAFVQECARVLAPDGKLIISTPNETVYDHRIENPFHCSEMSEAEFKKLLQRYFSLQSSHTQQLEFVAPWSPLCFAANRHGWNHLRGVSRLKRHVRKLLCPFLNPDATDQFRLSPIDTILSTDPAYSAIANPYSVRRSRGWQREQAMYLIAVAQKNAHV